MNYNMKIIEVKPQISNFVVVNGSEAWKEVVYSARMSGVPESVKDEDVFKMIVENSYDSALEHIIIKFDIKLSKGNSCELLEHRLASHSGFSTRYCVAKNKESEYEIIIPTHLLTKEQGVSKHMLEDGINNGLNNYEYLIKEKVPREIARYCLPFAQAVGIYHYTMNLRSLINFLSLRLCVRASPELRCLASQLYFLLEKELPIIENMIGCRGYMSRLCPENFVTGYRIGKNMKCPFSNPHSKCFIPTREQSSALTRGYLSEINKVQKILYKQWASWE